MTNININKACLIELDLSGEEEEEEEEGLYFSYYQPEISELIDHKGNTHQVSTGRHIRVGTYDKQLVVFYDGHLDLEEYEREFCFWFLPKEVQIELLTEPGVLGRLLDYLPMEDFADLPRETIDLLPEDIQVEIVAMKLGV